MLARDQWTKPSIEDFIAWLETKPVNEEYDWGDDQVCPCGQYAESIGLKHWPSQMSQSVPGPWYILNELAFGMPRTYGGLLNRVLEYKLKMNVTS